MVGRVAFILVGVCHASVSPSVEEASAVCGFGRHDACTQQRRGQAMLQQQRVGSRQGLLETQELPHSSTAYVQVSSSGISLPPQLAMWTNGSAGLVQLKEKARLHGASTSKSSPEGGSVPLEQWMSETLIPQAQLTIQQLNNELEAAKKEMELCGTNKGEAEEGIADDKTFLASAEQTSAHCEVSSKESHEAAVVACQSLKDFTTQLTIDDCSNVKQTCNDYKCQDLLDCMRRVKDFVNINSDPFDSRREACATNSGMDAHRATECLEDRRGIEKSYCSLKKAQMDICADFSGCHADKKKKFDKVKIDVKKLEEHVKANFKAMTCWNTGVSDCESHMVDVQHLDVIDVQPVAKEECSNDIGSTWDYSHVVCPGLEGFEKSDELETLAPTNGTSPVESSPAQ